jgi:ferredoxin-nitrite reductase
MSEFDATLFRESLPEFKEKTLAFYNGELAKNDYKGFSGKFGSYAQKDGKASMLRLRMSAGDVNKEKLNFVCDAIEKNNVDLVHFTTCQCIQLHNLQPEQVFEIMEEAIDHDIITYGGGGDYPRNVMCSSLSGVEKGEYFDVQPYAKAAASFLLGFIDAPKMPRKLKVGFSNSPANETHATFRDLGFAANADGTFDVYCCGGLGNNPKLGVKVDEQIDPNSILYYIEAMINTFKKYGNYQNRGKARTRYMIEAVGGEEAFKKAFHEELEAVKASKVLPLEIETTQINKEGDGTILEEDFQIIEQKQPGLYAVKWHPQGGSPKPEMLLALNKAMQDMDQVSMRIAPDETAYIINLTACEAKKLQALLAADNAANDVQTSISCIGSSICQVGVRDSQALLKAILAAVKEAGLSDTALPKLHISGCPSSCGTHQAGTLSFRGGIKMVDKKPVPAFVLFTDGVEEQGKETLAKEVGSIAIDDIPAFIVELGKKVDASKLTYAKWKEENPNGIIDTAASYLG